MSVGTTMHKQESLHNLTQHSSTSMTWGHSPVIICSYTDMPQGLHKVQTTDSVAQALVPYTNLPV